MALKKVYIQIEKKLLKLQILIKYIMHDVTKQIITIIIKLKSKLTW